MRFLIGRPHICLEGVPAIFRDMETALQVLKQPRKVPQRTNRKAVEKEAQEENRKSDIKEHIEDKSSIPEK